MLKRILVLLSETPSSRSAREYAFRLTEVSGADLAGVAGIDLAEIEAPVPGGIGVSAYKTKLEEELKGRANEVRRRVHDAFELECRAHNVPFEWLAFEGDPTEGLQMASETRDLVITGHDTAFHSGAREPLSETVARMLFRTPRPVLVCPDHAEPVAQVMIAYDGSISAMRAIQMFALLQLEHEKRMIVTAIDAAEEMAVRRATAAAAYLRSHGYTADANPIVSRDRPDDIMRKEISSRKIGALVMGAYGHRGFRELLFGSTTTALMENPPCAVFLYH